MITCNDSFTKSINYALIKLVKLFLYEYIFSLTFIMAQCFWIINLDLNDILYKRVMRSKLELGLNMLKCFFLALNISQLPNVLKLHIG